MCKYIHIYLYICTNTASGQGLTDMTVDIYETISAHQQVGGGNAEASDRAEAVRDKLQFEEHGQTWYRIQERLPACFPPIIPNSLSTTVSLQMHCFAFGFFLVF